MLAVVLLLPLTLASANAQGVSSVDVIVVLEDVANPSDVARQHRVDPRYVYEHALTGFAASIPEARLRGLERDPRVAFVSEDRPVQAAAQTTPTGVSRIEADDVHGTATGDGVRVAIIDTGIDSDHPDLVGNLDWPSGYDCINDDEDPEDDQGHGTHVAGTVAATDNSEGVVGVAPGATLVPFKVLDSTGSGYWSDVACGLDAAAALNGDQDPTNDIDLANLSLGGSGTLDGECGTTTDALYAAICSAVNGAGIAVTVAAGNDSQNASGFVPAAYPEVITVSAYSDTDGTTEDTGCRGPRWWPTCDEVFAPFSNYGDVVDVIAPGVDIESTTVGGKYGEKSGTSMAAPHVAGLAALVLEVEGALTPAELKDHLRATGQCPDGNENTGTGDCSTAAGTWDGDPDGVTEPMVNADFAVDSNSGTTGVAPTADDISASVAEDESATVTLAGSDPETCELIFSVSSSPSNGTVSSTIADASCTVDGGTYTDTATVQYTPSADYNGSDSFTFTVTDSDGNTASGTVTITVDPVNDAPVAVDDSASTAESTSVTIDVLVNDTDVDGDPLSVKSVTAPGYGTATVNDDDTVTYTPYDGSTVSDSFLYTVSDGALTDTAGVTVAVTEASSTMHVGDLDSASVNLGSSWQPAVIVLVVDANGHAANDATVNGTWDHPDGVTDEAGVTCTTDGTGRCTVMSDATLHKKVSSSTFTVDDVTHGTLSYEARSNTDPDGDSDGTTIAVTKP